MTTGCDIIH